MKTKGRKTKVSGPMEAAVAKMDAQLKRWAAQIDELTAQADKGGAEAEAVFLQSIENLKAKRAVAQAKVDQLRTTGQEKWHGVKAGVERAWRDLEVAFKDLRR